MAENVAYDRGLADPVGAVKRLIRNGALFDDLDLDVEMRALGISDARDVEQLRSLLRAGAVT